MGPCTRNEAETKKMSVAHYRQLNAKITWIPCPVRVVQGAKVKKQIVIIIAGQLFTLVIG